MRCCRRGDGNVLGYRLVSQAVDLVSVGAEDIVFAAGEVRVDLARQEGVLRDIGAARVVVEGQDQQPCYADDDAEGGEVGRDLEDAGISAERQYRRCGGQRRNQYKDETYISGPCCVAQDTINTA